MGVETKLYSDSKITFSEIKTLLEVKLGIVSEIEIKESWPDCAMFFFEYNGKKRTLWVFKNHYDFDKTKLYDSYSLSHNDDAVKIIKTIAENIGGWFLENDFKEKESAVYINPIDNIDEEMKKNSRQLYSAVAENVSYSDTDKFIKFLKDNKELIVKLNFGND